MVKICTIHNEFTSNNDGVQYLHSLCNKSVHNLCCEYRISFEKLLMSNGIAKYKSVLFK